MTFSSEWEQRFKENTHLSIWPWSDLVSFVMRHAKPGRGFRVLELGCGAGANIPLFQSAGADYHAIEGSETIVRALHERFPEYQASIKVGDFTLQLPFEGEFDLIFDRAAITHNNTAAIRHCLNLVHNRLKPGGKFIGIDWFSTRHSDYGKADLIDPHTAREYSTGPLANIGPVHFSDRAHLEDLFAAFQFSALEHKLVERFLPADDFVLGA